MAPPVAGDWDLPLSLDHDEAFESDASLAGPRNKRDCERCERPSSVCLCATLPTAPLRLAGRVIILQHPHEQKKRLATVPVLQKCVDPGCLTVLPGRAYRPGHPPHAALQAALAGAAEGRYPLLVLFPGAGARDVREVGAELRAAAVAASEAAEASEAHRQRQQQRGGLPDGQAQAETGGDVHHSGEPPSVGLQPAAQQQGGLQGSPRYDVQSSGQHRQHCWGSAGRQHNGQRDERQPLYVLFVIDGTWRQAKEMFKGAAPHVLQPQGAGFRVQLPPAAAQAATLRAASPGPSQQQQQQQQLTRQQDQQDQQGQQLQQQQQGEGQQEAASGTPPHAAAAARECQLAAAASTAPADGLGAPLLIRMEPLEGCVTTCEAVARALGALEPAGGAVEVAILRPLAQLARFQARFDPSTAARLAEARVGYSQSRRRMGLSRDDGIPALARHIPCESDVRNSLQAELDAAVEAAARDTMLAQCQALLSLADADELPHDPLFGMLPAPGQAVAWRRQACQPPALAAALAAVAPEAAALARAPCGAGVVGDSSLAATHLALAPGTCCRKRAADAAAPATQPWSAQRRRQQQLCAASLADACCTATPHALLGCGAGLAAAKRRRLLLLTAGKAGATPGSGVGSNSRVAPAGRRAARRVARDLSFTPAPAPRSASRTGTPATAASVSQLTASKPLSPGRSGGARRSLIVQPFNLLRSPGTRASIDAVNARVKASAAAQAAFELRHAQPGPADCTPPVAAAACKAPRCRAFSAIRLCWACQAGL
ncbi:hypothetical protein ABPG77_006775 [Micractinium sp. CCAP 211/92]